MRTVASDLSRPDAAREMYQTLKVDSVTVDILVNNAGFGGHGRFAEGDLDRDLEMLRLNIVVLTALTRPFLGDMTARGRGRIMNVASTAAFQPGPFMSVYYATKAYVLSFSEALSYEVRGSGVSVTALCPGVTATEFQDRAAMAGLLLTRMGMMDAESVARIGFRGMMAGRAVVIAGARNRALVQLLRFSPRRVVLAIVGRLQPARR